MDIESFVAETLVQIVNGAKKAANRAKDAAICFDARSVYGGERENALPHVPVAEQGEGEHTPDCGLVTYISFDLAVTTKKSAGKSGGAKIELAGLFSLGGKGDSASSQSVVSRVKFRVPIAYPVVRNNKRRRKTKGAQSAIVRTKE